MPDDHKKEQTIPNTGHGTNFQIHSSMFYAFYYAFNKNQDFILHTEDVEYGKFDDLVITTSQATIARQFKHRQKIQAEPIELNDFVVKKVMKN